MFTQSHHLPHPAWRVGVLEENNWLSPERGPVGVHYASSIGGVFNGVTTTARDDKVTKYFAPLIALLALVMLR